MPFSSLDSELCHVSSSFMSRREALREEGEEEEGLDVRDMKDMLCATGWVGMETRYKV